MDRLTLSVPHFVVMMPMLLMAAAMNVPLSTGEALPALQGEFLTGRKAVLPDAASGRVALLAVGFTYDSRFAVEAWVGRFRKDFGADRRVTFYEIPMISGLAKLGKWFIDSGMRRGTPQADHENVITVYSGADAWKQRLTFQSPKAAYLVLIDQQGKVRWRHTGLFDDAAYGALSHEAAALIAKQP